MPYPVCDRISIRHATLQTKTFEDEDDDEYEDDCQGLVPTESKR
jgi:hypothetical protein